MIPELRRTNYDDAIDYFKSVKAGKITPTLPLRDATTTEDTRYVIGSNPRFNYGF